MYQDHPMSYVGILWSELLYGDQPAGWPIAGTSSSVSKISRQDLLSYLKNQYVASNTIVCVSGNVKEALALKKVKKYFSKIKAAKPLSKPAVFDLALPAGSRRAEKQKNPACLLSERKTDQTHLCLGVRAHNLLHPARYVQEILGTILGGMMSSRLFVEVREKLGLAYYVSAVASADPDTGFLMTQAGIQNDKVEKGIAAILKEYKKISREKIPQAELKKAKDHIKGKMALLLESSDARASFYGLQELLENKILTPEKIYREINKISRSDILKLSRDIFRPDKMNLALIGPFKDKNKFQKLLKI
jgi:predicted Zn-dependent peptidase